MLYVFDLYYGQNFLGSVRRSAKNEYFFYTEEDIPKVSKNKKLQNYKSIPYKEEAGALAHGLAFLAVQCEIEIEEIVTQKTTRNRIQDVENNVFTKEKALQIIANLRNQFPKQNLAPIYTLSESDRINKIMTVIIQENRPLTAEEIFKKSLIGEKYRASVIAAISRLATKGQIKKLHIKSREHTRKVYVYTTAQDPLNMDDEVSTGK